MFRFEDTSVRNLVHSEIGHLLYIQLQSSMQSVSMLAELCAFLLATMQYPVAWGREYMAHIFPCNALREGVYDIYIPTSHVVKVYEVGYMVGYI